LRILGVEATEKYGIATRVMIDIIRTKGDLSLCEPAVEAIKEDIQEKGVGEVGFMSLVEVKEEIILPLLLRGKGTEK
jgi:hypothetical protein